MTSTGYGRRWRTVRVENPAAGAEWELKAPGNAYYRVISVAAVLTADATVATRSAEFIADDQSRTWYRQGTVGATTALEASTYCGHTGAVQATFASTDNFPLPVGGLLLLPGHRLRSLVANIQPADQWSAITALVDEIPSDIPLIGDGVVVSLSALEE